jgi:hypothetical protein
LQGAAYKTHANRDPFAFPSRNFTVKFPYRCARNGLPGYNPPR